MKTSKVRIGSLFLEPSAFRDSANKTIGAPALSEEVIVNRRNVTAKLSSEGEEIKRRVLSYFKTTHGIDVSLKWNRSCGCTMCPCSPGFNIMVEMHPVYSYQYKSSAKDFYRFTIFADSKMELDIQEPRYYPYFLKAPAKESEVKSV